MRQVIYHSTTTTAAVAGAGEETHESTTYSVCVFSSHLHLAVYKCASTTRGHTERKVTHRGIFFTPFTVSSAVHALTIIAKTGAACSLVDFRVQLCVLSTSTEIKKTHMSPQECMCRSSRRTHSQSGANRQHPSFSVHLDACASRSSRHWSRRSACCLTSYEHTE